MPLREVTIIPSQATLDRVCNWLAIDPDTVVTMVIGKAEVTVTEVVPEAPVEPAPAEDV